MKKKFYGALLVGSVLLAGGMVSCSDYDDDIDSLNNRVAAVEQTVKELQDKINAGAVITSVDPTENGVKVTLSNGESFELQNGAPGAAATIEIGSNGNWFINGEDTGKPSRGEKGDKGDQGDPGQAGTSATSKYYKPGENGYWIEVTVDANGKETETETTISWTPDGTMTAAWDSENGQLLVSNVKGYDGILAIALTTDLKSLVFEPDFYYQGIEALEARTFNYTEKQITAVDPDGEYGTDAPIELDGVAMTPGLVAKYHMNPSSANWKDIESLSYIADDKDYTRAGGVVKATVVDWEGEDGILTVHSQLTDGIIKDINDDNQVTVLALQANYKGKEENSVITSDYAALRATNYKNLVLANSAAYGAPVHTMHLYTTAQDAINNAASHEIVWNHTGLDVATLVQTHYDTPANAHVAWDTNAADGLVEDYGFKYSFELVGYHKGDNQTSESAHAIMNGSLLKPCMPVDGEQPESWDAATQNKAEKDREPLVRVVLTDVISNKVAAVGYIKFKIVEKETPVQSEVILTPTPSFPFTDGYTVNCTENETTLKIEWHDFEEDILAQLEQKGISKEDFHNNFTLDGGEANATQYDGTEVTSQPTTNKGIVSQTTSDTGAEETQIITWTLKNNEAYQLFKNNESVSVNIRYSKQIEANVYQYIYITLTWTPSPRNVQPAGALENSDKIKNYWYAHNKINPESGYDDIHANVETVGETNATDQFKSDILNTFEGNDVTVSGVDGIYTAFQDANLTKTFTFVDPQGSELTPIMGNSGTMYDITVSADGKTLYANVVSNPLVKQPVVVLNGSVLEYQGKDDNTNYSFARDILNADDHKDFIDEDKNGRKTFTAQIQINAANCDYVPFDLSNNTFYAKFLRPITISDLHETNFVDATTGGATADLKLSFTDWRDHNFDDATATKNKNYYQYYDVESIEQKGDILTDLNGQEGQFDRKLSDVTENVKFTFKAPTKVKIQDDNNHYFGTLTYLNNGTTVGNFKIKVPFDVTYDWGTIRVWVICNISQTEAN